MQEDNISKGEIVIYTSADGKITLDAKLENDTIWLTQEQMATLFNVNRPAITKHINNIYKTDELDMLSTCSILEHMGTENKQSYYTKYYNLDMIVAVGYRVTSKIATQFRKWATNVLKDYLVKGYALNNRVVLEQQEKLRSLQQVVELLNRSITNQAETIGQAQDISKILHQFVKGLNLLDDFDHKKLDTIGITKKEAVYISQDEFLSVVDKMKGDFASEVFAQPKDESFNSSINQIYQTFDDNELYPSLEEKASMLLYFIVKNHSFLDGNKRIGASCFLYFLDKNGLLYDDFGQTIIDDATLFALTLLIAESEPSEMETIKKVTISILNRR
ncbi:MAG: Fic/DOC family protein [Alphaproteobacteria bacterium]|nr:Fic/DOC family protein [Alphaproteobacteria bacterium]